MHWLGVVFVLFALAVAGIGYARATLPTITPAQPSAVAAWRFKQRLREDLRLDITRLELHNGRWLAKLGTEARWYTVPELMDEAKPKKKPRAA